MPSTWNRKPEELRKAYISNTEALYRIVGRGIAKEVDESFRTSAEGLWANSGSIGQQHVEA